MRISDWSSDVCSSDLRPAGADGHRLAAVAGGFARSCPARLAGAAGHPAAVAGDPAVRDPCLAGAVAAAGPVANGDRKSVVEGTSVYVRLDLAGRRIIKKKI